MAKAPRGREEVSGGAVHGSSAGSGDRTHLGETCRWRAARSSRARRRSVCPRWRRGWVSPELPPSSIGSCSPTEMLTISVGSSSQATTSGDVRKHSKLCFFTSGTASVLPKLPSACSLVSFGRATPRLSALLEEDHWALPGRRGAALARWCVWSCGEGGQCPLRWCGVGWFGWSGPMAGV